MTAAPQVAEQQWVRCTTCAALLYRKRLRRHLDVCPECGRHRRLDAPERVRQLTDPGSFTALPVPPMPVDPIGFVDTVPYRQRLAAARAATGLAEAVLCGEARIEGCRLALAVMDFRFLGGSLGTGVGELITRTAEHALAEGLPLLLVTASGGARMQEGALSLMQMATVTQALAQLQAAGLLTVSLITDPTYGGVAASFATSTDVVIAETGARMGFAGPRVIEQTIRQALPDGFQTAEFLLRHGQVDMVVDRHSLRSRLRLLLAAGAGGRRATGTAAGGGAGEHRATGGGAGADEEPPVPLSGGEDTDVPRDPWSVVQLARDINRPGPLDYLATVFDSFVELHGDRLAGDCPAIVAGLARLGAQHLVVVGHRKGHHTRQLLAHNFGMGTPAGYRKAQRVMRLAARLGLPVVTLIDTPGAYPGVQAEEHGQAGAIAESILLMSSLATPVVAVVTGEGGSGGALALAVADRVLMLQHAVYSVISPEGCAAILWGDATAAPRAAQALKLTAPDMLRLGVADAVVPEPAGGAREDAAEAAARLRHALVGQLAELVDVPVDELVRRRRERFRGYGGARRHTTDQGGPA